MLAGVVALALVGVGAYAVPRLVTADDGSITAFPAVAGAAPSSALPVTGSSPSSRPSSPPSAAGPRQQPTQKATSQKATSRQKSSQKKKSVATLAKGTGTPDTPFSASGPRTYKLASEREPSASRSGRLYRFDVRVEKGLDIDADAAARAIAKTLNDKRSWRGTGRWRFQLVAAGDTADLHAYIATPGTTDRLCAPLLTQSEVSCHAGNRVVLNARRWLTGAPAYGSDVAGYREYLVNHEFGHALGFGHLTCPRSGAPSPVMLQQTKGLGGCRKNPWPMTSGD